VSEFSKLFPDYKPNDMIRRQILPETIAESIEYAVYQAEEIFSDMFAYAVFGPSFLHAFSYILAPGSGSARDPKYPTHETRIATIRGIAKNEGVALPNSTELNFTQATRRADPQDQFIVRIAETSVSEITPTLWQNVSTIIANGRLRRPSQGAAARHLAEFRIGIPSPNPVCLGDIISAGWLRYAETLSTTADAKELSKQLDNLNELLLKTIEVLEYQKRVSS
jgi:hypothetical protein